MSTTDVLKMLERDFKEWRIEDFECKVLSLAERHNIKNLKLLLKLFKDYGDDFPDIDVLYIVIHAIETYPNDAYVKTLLEELHVLLTQSTFWTDCLFNRIFNDPSCVRFFEKNMELAKKEDLLKLFELIERESPHHKALIQKLRKKL